MKKVVIFGIGENAQLLKHYLETDSKYINDYEVVGFCIDKEYRKTDIFFGKPLINFEDIEKIFPPEEHYLFIALGYTQMNSLREIKYLEGKKKGYRYINYISSNAIVNYETIGENNFIVDNNVIQPFVKIGNNNIFMGGGVYLNENSEENSVYVSNTSIKLTKKSTEIKI